jgi:hypothetical protein
LPILFGSTSRRHRFPRFVGDYAQPEPHLVGPRKMGPENAENNAENGSA